MSDFALGMKKVAHDLIGKYGNSITLIHSYDCTYNPATGKDTCTEDSHPITGTPSSDRVNDDSIASVEVGDVMITIETNLVVINDADNKWTANYKGIDYNIVGMYPVDAQDITVIYTLHLRA